MDKKPFRRDGQKKDHQQGWSGKKQFSGDRSFNKGRKPENRKSFEGEEEQNQDKRFNSKYKSERNNHFGNNKKFDRSSKPGYGKKYGTENRFDRDNTDNRRPDDKKRSFSPRPDRKINLRKFEEEDLSFGRKPAPSKKSLRDEITFSKSLEEPNHEVKGHRKTEEDHPRRFTGNRQGNDHTKPWQRDENRDNGTSFHSFRSNKRFKRPSDIHFVDEEEVEKFENSEHEPMPLNKFIAHCGICSRRDAVGLVKGGKVSVNEEVITEPGFRVNPDTDKVVYNGKAINVQEDLVYILMNKPKGYITTMDDPQNRKTVVDILGTNIEQRVFPVGRLDRNTTGLLLLTNDGNLAQKLAHPKYEIRKIYHAILDKDLTKSDFEKILAGVVLEDGPAPVDSVAYLDKKNEIGLEIHSGKNRIVRRIFESLGYNVDKLDRVMYAGLTKKNILRGKWRFLSRQEVINLKFLNK